MQVHDIPDALTLATRSALKEGARSDTVEPFLHGFSPSSSEQSEVEGCCGPYDDDGENC
jgi:hypothetical protein